MDNIIYDKPFKTYDELIEIMESRNIEIPDYNFARKVLGSLSYYTIINGYKNTFLSIQGTDNFVDGTNFNELYTLHLIDTSLNNIILKNILFVEQYLKTRISYLVSQNYGVYTDKDDLSNMNQQDYLCRHNYSRSIKTRNNILRQIKNTLSSKRINASVAHYANDKNHVPPWILTTTITFGLTIKWFSILKNEDRKQICDEFIPSNTLTTDEKKEFMTVALSLLREYRNKIAHGNRVFNVSNLPILPKKQLLFLSDNALSETEYNVGFGKNDLFAVILTCFILLDDHYILLNFMNDLHYILNPYSDTTFNRKTVFEIFDLPNNLFQRLEQVLIRYIPT